MLSSAKRVAFGYGGRYLVGMDAAARVLSGLLLGLVGCATPPADAPPTVLVTPSLEAQAPSTALAGHEAAPAPAPTLSLSPGARPVAPPGQPFVSKCEGVVLDLAMGGGAPGDVGLPVKATLRNTGRKAISLMLTGDGSDSGRRNPTFAFELTPDRASPVGLCGMMNAITDADFINLAPGESRELEWLFAPTPAGSGRYTLSATYRNDPMSDPGQTPEALVPRFRRTVACEAKSHTLTFDWDSATQKATLRP